MGGPCHPAGWWGNEGAGSLLMKEQNAGDALILFYEFEPGCDLGRDGVFEDHRGALDDRSGTRPAGEAVVNGLDQLRDAHRLDEDFIGLADDGLGGDIHLGKTGEEKSDRAGMGAAHRADDREAIPGSGHVEIAEEDIVVVGENEPQSLRDIAGGGYLESHGVQQRRQGGEYDLVIVDQQDPVHVFVRTPRRQERVAACNLRQVYA
jgi:hypothetical protein